MDSVVGSYYKRGLNPQKQEGRELLMKMKKFVCTMVGVVMITSLFAGCKGKEEVGQDVQDSGGSQVIADTIPESDCITKKEVDKNTYDGFREGKFSVSIGGNVSVLYPMDYGDHYEAGKVMNYLTRRSDEYCIVIDNNKLEDGTNSKTPVDIPIETELENIKNRISTLYGKENVHLSETCTLDIESTENVKLTGFNVDEFDGLKFKGRINNVNKKIGSKMVEGGYYVYGYITKCKGSTFSFYEIIFDTENEDIIKAYVDKEVDEMAHSFIMYKSGN